MIIILITTSRHKILSYVIPGNSNIPDIKRNKVIYKYPQKLKVVDMNYRTRRWSTFLRNVRYPPDQICVRGLLA